MEKTRKNRNQQINSNKRKRKKLYLIISIFSFFLLPSLHYSKKTSFLTMDYYIVFISFHNIFLPSWKSSP